MSDATEAISLLVVLEFVIVSAIVLLVVPLKVAAPVLPLLLFFAVALYLYLS